MIPRADVAVVGGGPAGSTTARLLARRGWDVVVLDRARFPRPKPCGECINPGAVALLDRLDMREVVEALSPALLRGWKIRDASTGSTATGTFGPGHPPAMAVPRERFDHALLVAARNAGARVLEGCKVDGVETKDALRDSPCAGPAVHVRRADGTTWRLEARVVVGADGLRSVTARALAAHHRRPRLRKLSVTGRIRGAGPSRDRGRLVLGDGRVLGLAPVHAAQNVWNGTVVVDSDRFGEEVAGSPARFLARALSELPGWDAAPRIEAGPWASGPFDWPVRSPAGPGVVLVGDAAGYYDPLTGQGIYRALRSALLAADAVDEELRRAPSASSSFPGYVRATRREFRAERWLQKLIEGVVSRESLRRKTLEVLSRLPHAVSVLIETTGNAISPGSLLDPRRWTVIPTPGGDGADNR